MFADALRVNKTLKYLDLENNNLTDFGEDSSAVAEFFDVIINYILNNFF